MSALIYNPLYRALNKSKSLPDKVEDENKDIKEKNYHNE